MGKEPHQDGKKGDGGEGERVGGADAKNEGGDDATERERGGEAERDAEENRFHAIGDDQSQHVGMGSAERHANADFPNAAANGVGKDPVDSDGGKDKSKPGECSEQEHVEALGK